MTNDGCLYVAACVLAAGRSRRMGQENKLLSVLNGKTLLQHVLHALQSSNVDEVHVITGHDRAQVCDSISGFNVMTAHNPDYCGGLSTSVRLAVNRLGDHVDGVLFCLGDMPFVSATTLNALITEFNGRDEIIVPTYGGHDGNPLLWSRRYFDDFKNLQGDRGAKFLLNEFPQKVKRVDVDNVGIVLDIDDPDALEFLRSKFKL